MDQGKKMERSCIFSCSPLVIELQKFEALDRDNTGILDKKVNPSLVF